MPGPETLFWPATFAAWADAVRNAGLVVGGIAAFGVALWALSLNRRRTANDSKRLVNDTYVKAIEQLGHDKMEVRLGALYALERIAREPEDFELHWAIMETLCAYVRERPASGWPTVETANHRDATKMPTPLPNTAQAETAAPTEPGNEPSTPSGAPKMRRPPADVAAVFSILKRRSQARKQQQSQQNRRLDLRHADLSFAELNGVALEWTDLSDANLRASDLIDSNLQHAILKNANCQSTDFQNADLQSVDLSRANLRQAILWGKRSTPLLPHGYLTAVNLTGADLRGANYPQHSLTGTTDYARLRKMGARWNNGCEPKIVNAILTEPGYASSAPQEDHHRQPAAGPC